jgi:hypothetical protein
MASQQSLDNAALVAGLQELCAHNNAIICNLPQPEVKVVVSATAKTAIIFKSNMLYHVLDVSAL